MFVRFDEENLITHTFLEFENLPGHTWKRRTGDYANTEFRHPIIYQYRHYKVLENIRWEQISDWNCIIHAILIGCINVPGRILDMTLNDL